MAGIFGSVVGDASLADIRKGHRDCASYAGMMVRIGGVASGEDFCVDLGVAQTSRIYLAAVLACNVVN